MKRATGSRRGHARRKASVPSRETEDLPGSRAGARAEPARPPSPLDLRRAVLLGHRPEQYLEGNAGSELVSRSAAISRSTGPQLAARGPRPLASPLGRILTPEQVATFGREKPSLALVQRYVEANARAHPEHFTPLLGAGGLVQLARPQSKKQKRQKQAVRQVAVATEGGLAGVTAFLDWFKDEGSQAVNITQGIGQALIALLKATRSGNQLYHLYLGDQGPKYLQTGIRLAEALVADITLWWSGKTQTAVVLAGIQALLKTLRSLAQLLQKRQGWEKVRWFNNIVDGVETLEGLLATISAGINGSWTGVLTGISKMARGSWGIFISHYFGIEDPNYEIDPESEFGLGERQQIIQDERFEL